MKFFSFLERKGMETKIITSMMLLKLGTYFLSSIFLKRFKFQKIFGVRIRIRKHRTFQIHLEQEGIKIKDKDI